MKLPLDDEELVAYMDQHWGHLCNARPQDDSIHLCDSSVDHVADHHECRCGHVWEETA